MGWFTDWWSSFWGSVGEHLATFLRGPGGDALKEFAKNLVMAAGAAGAAMLVQIAKNQVAGRSALSDVDWKKAAINLEMQAIEQGIPLTAGLIDGLIGQAVASAPQPKAIVAKQYS